MQSFKDFWRYWNNLATDKLCVNANLHMFKAGIKPMWEDQANVHGGKWVCVGCILGSAPLNTIPTGHCLWQTAECEIPQRPRPCPHWRTVWREWKVGTFVDICLKKCLRVCADTALCMAVWLCISSAAVQRHTVSMGVCDRAKRLHWTNDNANSICLWPRPLRTSHISFTSGWCSFMLCESPECFKRSMNVQQVPDKIIGFHAA